MNAVASLLCLRALFGALLLGLLALGPLPADAAAPAAAPALPAGDAEWLAAHRQWRVGVVLQVPYAQRDGRNQTLYGAYIELMELLAARLDVRLQWQTFRSREALDTALREQRIDLAPGLTQTPAGLHLWRFSEPFMRVSYLVLGERDGQVGIDLDRLGRADPLALSVPDTVLDYLHNSYPNLYLQPAPSPLEALHRVLGGQARYLVVDEAQLSLLGREVEQEALAIVGDIGLPQLLRIGSRRDWPQLAAILDNALQAVPAKQLDQLHRRWLQPPGYVRVAETLGFWRVVSLLLGLLALIALALLLGVRRQLNEQSQRLLEARRQIELRDDAAEAPRLAQFSIDHSSLGIFWINWDSRVRYANHAVERLLGYPPGSLVGRPLADFKPDLHMDRWLEVWKRVRSGDDGPASFESEYRCADGSRLPVEVSLSFLRYARAEYLVVFVADIRERRRALAALRESEARLQSVAANVPGLVFRLERDADGNGRFTFVSEGAEGLLGFPAAQLRRRGGLRDQVHSEERAAYLASQSRALHDACDWHWQGRVLTAGGEQRWLDIKATARRLDDGAPVWDGIAWDISANKRAELALGESRAELRELSAHLESVREEEKAHIAREVHDELGQVLTGLKLETSMAELSYAGLDPGLRERLGNMKRQIAHLFQLVRDVATALRPPILDAGLASAIEWQARRFEARTQIPCLVEVPEQLPALSDAKATGLFRILQEALTNITRHAEAQSVALQLTVEDGQLCLSISDDGRGFAVDGTRPRSFGLVGMHERALMMSGSLQIDSRPGEGTTLTVRVPLDPAPPAQHKEQAR